MIDWQIDRRGQRVGMGREINSPLIAGEVEGDRNGLIMAREVKRL